MIAATRYQLALLLHSQRYLPPAIAFAALLAVLYGSRNAPVPPEFAVSAGGLTVVTCWLAVALADIEDPVQRLVTASHARLRAAVPLGGLVLAVLACAVVLTAGSLLWAVLVHGGVGAAVLGWGALAHLAGAATGLTVGLPCSRLLVPRIGYTVALALPVLAAVLLLRWVPLVNPMLRALTNGTAYATPVLVCAAVSVCALGLSATVTAARQP